MDATKSGKSGAKCGWCVFRIERCHRCLTTRQFPPKGIRQDLPAAYDSYKKYLEYESDSKAQFIVGFFYATGFGGVEMDQGKVRIFVPAYS